MTELDGSREIATEDLSDELSDEALDRTEGERLLCICQWCLRERA
jgi:hypothetical protein